MSHSTNRGDSFGLPPFVRTVGAGAGRPITDSHRRIAGAYLPQSWSVMCSNPITSASEPVPCSQCRFAAGAPGVAAKSQARGVGSCATAQPNLFGLSRPSPDFVRVRSFAAFAAFGVGRSLSIAASDGRTAAPGDSDRLLPYWDAAGVGSSFTGARSQKDPVHCIGDPTSLTRKPEAGL